MSWQVLTVCGIAFGSGLIVGEIDRFRYWMPATMALGLVTGLVSIALGVR